MKLLVWLVLVISLVEASPGDNLNRFKRCVRECKKVNCGLSKFRSQWEFARFDENLKLLLWDCEQDCDYQCQRIITRERKHKNKEVYQFHGKWPFKRIFGIQELVSMIFSIGNFIPHLLGFFKIKKQLKDSHSHEAKLQFSVILVSSAITCLAWTFSTVFHMRDFLVTERLDYYFAGLTVLSGLFMGTCRLFSLYESEKFQTFIISSCFFVALYSAHVYRLVTDWLYTYNMQANVTVGIIQNVFMTINCFNLYSKYYNEKINSSKSTTYYKRVLLSSFFSGSDKLFSLYPLVLGTIVTFGMSLEIFDFAPVFFDLVDAHSLWHLVTIIPVCFGWYEWLIWDVREHVDRKKVE